MLRAVYLLIGIFFCTNILAQYEDAYKIPYPRRFRVLDSLINNRTVYLNDLVAKNQQISVFEDAAKKYNDDEALLFAKIFRFSVERQFKKFSSEKANQICFDFINQCDQLNAVALKAYVFLCLGNYYFYSANQKNTSYYYYLKSYKVYKNLTPQQYHLKGLSIGFLSNCYYRLLDYPQAIKFGLESIENEPNNYYNIGTLDIVGMSYLKLNKYDSAILHFNNCYRIVDSFSKINIYVGWLGIIEGNLAYCYQKKGQINLAISSFKRAIDTTIKYNILDNTCGFAIALSEIYVKAQNSECEKYIPIAISTTHSNGNSYDKFNLYTMLKNYHYYKNDIRNAKLYADSQLLYKDTLVAQNGHLSILKADFEIESELRDIQESLLLKEIKQQNIIKYSLIALIILVAIVTLLVLNRARLQYTVAQKNIETKRLISENELALAKEQLKGLTNMIVEKNHLIEQLELQNKSIQNNETIVELQNLTILTDEQWNEFKNAFEKVHQGFLNNLKNKIANLTPAETRLLALAKLKLTTKEMASSLGVTTQAIRTAWYRLRAKLNLSNEVSLEEFVETI